MATNEQQKGEEMTDRTEQSPAAPPPASPPPPRSVRPATLAVAAAALAAALWLGTKIGARSAGTEGAAAAEASEDSNAPAQYYTCGMHPWVILPHGGACPICGMDLVPLDPAKFSGEVTIDPVVVQNIGVRVAEVKRGPLIQTLRTVGIVDYDETRVRDVNVKIAGWVQNLHVDTLGQAVQKGQPLFEVYSPELYSAQQEYLLALRTGDKELIAPAKRKLEYYDIPASEISAIEERGKPTKTLTLRSPYSGVVTEKKTFEGMQITPGMQVFRIADLSKAWVRVTLYEYQLPFVHVGQEATITLSYAPGPALKGKVVYVYPYLDTKARQIQVRVELDNPGLQLKPGMYAAVALEGRLDGDRVFAPRESVIDTGERKVAFVSKGEGRFEPRQVRTGVETGDGTVEILEGLEPGEPVVTSGQFLLDSEAKVREALAKMIRGNLAGKSEPAPASATEAAPVASLPAEAEEALSAALDGYLAVGRALAADDFGPVAARAGDAASALERLTQVEIPGQPRFWSQHDAPALRDSARALASATSLADARKSFAAMSGAVGQLLRATGIPPEIGALDVLHCPMFGGGEGSTWLQGSGAVHNPYFGKAMLACSDRREPLPRAAGAER